MFPNVISIDHLWAEYSSFRHRRRGSELGLCITSYTMGLGVGVLPLSEDVSSHGFRVNRPHRPCRHNRRSNPTNSGSA
jgi:hypothetical protein